MKNLLSKLFDIAKLIELIFYISFYSFLSLSIILLTLIMPLLFLLKLEHYSNLVNKIFVMFEKHTIIMVIFFIFAGLFSIGRVFLNNENKIK